MPSCLVPLPCASVTVPQPDHVPETPSGLSVTWLTLPDPQERNPRPVCTASGLLPTAPTCGHTCRLTPGPASLLPGLCQDLLTHVTAGMPCRLWLLPMPLAGHAVIDRLSLWDSLAHGLRKAHVAGKTSNDTYSCCDTCTHILPPTRHPEDIWVGSRLRLSHPKARKWQALYSDQSVWNTGAEGLNAAKTVLSAPGTVLYAAMTEQ